MRETQGEILNSVERQWKQLQSAMNVTIKEVCRKKERNYKESLVHSRMYDGDLQKKSSKAQMSCKQKR